MQIAKHEQNLPAYLRINAMQQVPTLEIDDGDRTLFLGQSLAIIEYLDERFPERRLLPAEVQATGAEAADLLFSANAGLEPRPLRECASGGEISRVMLALKNVLARVSGADRLPVVADDGTLVGLVCFNRRHGHFCIDA